MNFTLIKFFFHILLFVVILIKFIIDNKYLEVLNIIKNDNNIISVYINMLSIHGYV